MKKIIPGRFTVVRYFLTVTTVILLVFNSTTAFLSTNAHRSDDITITPDETVTTSATETPVLPDTDTPAPTFTELPTDIAPTLTDLTITPSPVSDETLGGKFISDEVLVRFRRNTSRGSIAQCIKAVNAAIKSDVENLNTLVLSVPVGRVADSIARLQSCPGIRYAEPNYLVEIADVIPSDADWGNQYGLINIRAPQGWEFTTGSSSVTIAIIDTGIDLNHPDLAGKIVGGIDIFNGDNDPQDDNGHGTHVAGIAGAVSNNGTGIAGVSWGARLMPIKVLNAAGNGTYADVADGIIWATDHNAQVINLSLGGSSPSQFLQDAVDYASSHGVVLVAASGNSGSNLVLYPAHYPNVIAVAATDGSNARAWFSNYGPEVDLSAPGVSIYSTSLGGYGLRNGTSMSTPYVSGLAAILRGIPGNASPSAIVQQMQSTALDLGSSGWDDFYGHGLIQMDAAIQLVWMEPTQTALPANPAGGFVPPPTFPPTLTETPPPTPTETVTASPTFVSTNAPVIVNTETPEVVALNSPETVIPSPNWAFPICGFSLIFLGGLLFWYATRNRHDDR